MKGTIHWVSATDALPVEVRLYDRLFTAPDPEAVEGKDLTEFLNPGSSQIIHLRSKKGIDAQVSILICN